MTKSTRRTKLAAMVALTAMGGSLMASCGLTDIRHNLVAGTLAGFKGVTTSWWTALLPPAPENVYAGLYGEAD